MKLLTPILGALAITSTTASAAPPAAPGNLIFASSSASNQASIQWDDNSDNETAFLVEYRFEGAPSFTQFTNTAPPDSTTFGITGFTPGAPVTFRVRAANADGNSPYSNEAVVVTANNYQIVASCVTLTPGDDFSHRIETTFGSTVTPDEPLPAWLSWDPQTQTLSGQAAPEGITKVGLSASSGPHIRTRDFFVQAINQPPTSAAPPDAIDLTEQPGGLSPLVIDLAEQFEDPDFGRAAAMNTPFGPINVGLYDDPTTGAPLTVANFFAYVEGDRWANTFFHRSVEKFVIQGGGYKPDGITEGSFVSVEDFPPVQNEFSAQRPNICGTISMAKLGGNPDSATSEWFFSLNDNRANLDNQNGGFTVFGRAAGMDVVDQISAFETGNYGMTLDGQARNFDDWPLSTTSENSPLVSELALITSVVEIPTLQLTTTGDDPAVATASLEGSQLTITPVGPGHVGIQVTATDLDGASVSETWDVTINSAYPAWAGASNLTGERSSPTENRDGGSLVNLHDYAFGGDPLDPSDDAGLSPAATSIEDSPAYTFRHRKFQSDLTYTVQTSPDLKSWTSLWTTSDGNDAAPVANVEDQGQFWRITVRPSPNENPVHFRLATTLAE